jgi:putative ATPase
VTPDDLFGQAAEERRAARAPLAARLRPRTLDEVVGQRHLVGPDGPFRALVDGDRLRSTILWGPPGTGKTTLARLVADGTEKEFVSLSAVTAGVKDVREVVEAATRRLGEQGRGTMLFLDEVHRFNRAQQDALLPAVEDGLVVLIGATTENPYFSVNAPLLSRSTLFRLEPLALDELATVVHRALDAEAATADEDAVVALAESAEGDARAVLTTLEVALALAGSEPGAGEAVHVTRAHIERARQARLVHYGEDDHYDQISALIKSVRGSDPDAGLYWLARMLEAGEDARFIARRLVVLASEDVGEADPLALVVADAAARAVEFVGLPEAQLNLAQAVVHLAVAPKSNRVTVALGAARADVTSGARADVPAHLRDAHYRGASALGHGSGYRYPHDFPDAWVAQGYRPAAIEGHVYYEPSERGYEATVAARVARLRAEMSKKRGAGPDGVDAGKGGGPVAGGGATDGEGAQVRGDGDVAPGGGANGR